MLISRLAVDRVIQIDTRGTIGVKSAGSMDGVTVRLPEPQTPKHSISIEIATLSLWRVQNLRLSKGATILRTPATNQGVMTDPAMLRTTRKCSRRKSIKVKISRLSRNMSRNRVKNPITSAKKQRTSPHPTVKQIVKASNLVMSLT
ncbi:hypothetical protein IAG25_36230 [Caballeronia sp. EK]|uniref:hypothetical protein n=1 Tax=Caballeronia sp. EK TaxID=2767469 RepID=UPI0016566AA3|nr:hypothetical protein [Caballeronia sp. EK]MBC8642251.1 hypothetical protein [Caballeronia sp. EK]